MERNLNLKRGWFYWGEKKQAFLLSCRKLTFSGGVNSLVRKIVTVGVKIIFHTSKNIYIYCQYL